MTKVDIPLGTSDYYRKSAGNPPVSTRNVYYEDDPTNTAEKATLIRRPGIKKLLSVGDGPIRKIYYRPDVFNNDFFVISGPKLYRVNREGAETFSQTPIFGNLYPESRLDVTASGSTLFITDEDGLYYTDGVASLQKIDTPDDVKISKLGYVAGYIICVVKDSQRFYWIEPSGTGIDPLNFAEAEGLPDGIVDVIILGDQIYFLGKETIEVWYLSGDAASPFQRIQGKLMGTGALGDTACIVSGNDAFLFVATDGTVKLGPTMTRVSNSGIEERIRRAIVAQNLANL